MSKKKNTTTENQDTTTEIQDTTTEIQTPAIIGTTKIYTDDEAKAEAFRLKKNEASKKMLARKAEAIAKLIALAERVGSEEEKSAARYMKGGRQLGLVTPKNEVIEYLTANGPQTPDQIWMKFKLGNYEMKKVLKAGAIFKDGTYQIATAE